jgi:hypothetical protein
MIMLCVCVGLCLWGDRYVFWVVHCGLGIVVGWRVEVFLRCWRVQGDRVVLKRCERFGGCWLSGCVRGVCGSLIMGLSGSDSLFVLLCASKDVGYMSRVV